MIDIHERMRKYFDLALKKIIEDEGELNYLELQKQHWQQQAEEEEECQT